MRLSHRRSSRFERVHEGQALPASTVRPACADPALPVEQVCEAQASLLEPAFNVQASPLVPVCDASSAWMRASSQPSTRVSTSCVSAPSRGGAL